MAPQKAILSVRRFFTLALHSSIIAAAAFTCLAAAEIPPADEAEGKAGPIYRLDLSAFNSLDLGNPAAVKRAWDTTQMAVSIQGNANRRASRLFLRCMPESDDFWWNYLREEHGWIKGREVIEVASFGDLLKIFNHELKEVVTYREDEAHSSNLAATIAGADGRFVLRAAGYLNAEGRVIPRQSLGLIKPGPDFRILRTILNSPTWHREVMDGVATSPKGKDACFVSAPIFFELIRKAHSEKQKPNAKNA